MFIKTTFYYPKKSKITYDNAICQRNLSVLPDITKTADFQ